MQNSPGHTACPSPSARRCARPLTAALCALTVVFVVLANAHADAQASVGVVAAFDPVNALNPYAPLIEATDGHFYGTTSQGGAENAGTVFRMSPDGVVTVVYTFTGGPDGAYPYAGVVQAADGNFYGTTLQGGDFNAGTVFRLTAGGALSVVHAFTGGGDGAYPSGNVIQAVDGNFYGTTSQGGAFNAGTVFQLAPDGTVTTVNAFTGGADGAYPVAGLIQAADGSFLGTTLQGGAAGAGVVFQLAAAGTVTVLHAFTGDADGGYPYAGIIQASDGNFYGTTLLGGASGAGIVFQLMADGTFNVLHAFAGADGAYPYAGVIQSSDGIFYGTTAQGGQSEAGVVFEVTSAGSFTTTYAFTGGDDGANPTAALLIGADGNFYGTTDAGGALGGGTVFRFKSAVLPTITWNPPAPIAYGTRLTATQLNATASVPGTFTYMPAAGTKLHAGLQTLSVVFTPDDTTVYAAVTSTVSLTVTPRATVMNWPSPSAISYGTALGSAQLNARANTSGVFVYTPPAGTVLEVGTYTLEATFLPATTDYTSVTGAVQLTVTTATPVIEWRPPAAIVFGTPLTGMQLNARASVGGTFTYSPMAGAVLDAGSQTLSVTFMPADTANYTSATATVPLIVALRTDFTLSGGGNVYRLQFTPAAGARGLVVAGYALVLDPAAGLTVVGTCSYYTVHSGSGRGGGYHTTTTHFDQTCTWDLYGNLLRLAAGAPVVPSPISVSGSQTIYAADDGAGVYTGTDAAVGGGFVYTPGAHYSWLTSNAYAVLQQQTPYTVTVTLKSDGDLPLTVFGIQASALQGVATVNATTCAGQIPVGSTCAVTVTYDPSRLHSATGLAYDTLDVNAITDAGQTHDFVQSYTIVVSSTDGGAND